MIKTPRFVKVQSEAGILRVLLPDNIRSELHGKEYMWSKSLVSYMEQGMIENSGRITNRLLNKLLHRDLEFERIKIRTMTDRIEETGMAYLKAQTTLAETILQEYGWDPKSLLPLPGTDLKPYGTIQGNVVSTDTKSPDEEQENPVREIIREINARREPEARIPDDAGNIWDIEPSDSSAVYISLDAVGSKRQKDNRPKRSDDNAPVFFQDENDGPVDYTRAPDPKKRPKVETAVAHIQVDEKKYLFAAQNMFLVCKLVLAFLLEKDLLKNRSLVFFSDGGKDIRKCVDDIFAFCPHTVVLDWFHLKKHCLELLSMTLYGGKENRSMQYEVRRRLFHILWAGNTDGAINFLSTLSSDKVRNPRKLQELIDYLKNNAARNVIACYALRRKLGLRISSNPVEKANDLIVASRQKGDSMSWSRSGSWALAAVTCMYLNHEADYFHIHHTVQPEMYTDYGIIFDLESSAA